MDQPPSYEAIMNQPVINFIDKYRYAYPSQTYIYTSAYPKEKHNNIRLITKPKQTYKEQSFGCCILL